jgi:hypothetical protein
MSSTHESHDKIINKIYYDPAGYGSITSTFKEALQQDKTITLNYVKQWFKSNLETTKQVKGSNSFVAPYPYYEYQLDLMFFADLKNQKFEQGMLCIDIFTKYAAVVPIKSKKEDDIAAGILECMEKMGKKPEIIYTDDEGALHKPSIQDYFKENKITHYITRNHAWFAERFIRTFKLMLYTRIDQRKVENPQWVDFVYPIMLTNNNKMVHSSIKMTPNEARKPSNAIDVKTNIQLQATFTRKYPELEVGSNVKIFKKKTLGQKERVSSFMPTIFIITEIIEQHGQKYYKVQGKDRLYLRVELLKV